MLTNESLIFPEQVEQKQLEQEGIKGGDRDEGGNRRLWRCLVVELVGC